MNVNQLKDSRFLKKEDVGNGLLVTIAEVYEENVAKEGAPEEFKWCIKFHEHDKPLVLNATNGQIIAKIAGSEESDAWTGAKVVLYNDPNVSFGGKITGGIRVRAPRNLPAQGQTASAGKQAGRGRKPAQQPIPEPDPADAVADADCPF